MSSYLVDKPTYSSRYPLSTPHTPGRHSSNVLTYLYLNYTFVSLYYEV